MTVHRDSGINYELVPERCRPCYDLGRMIFTVGEFPALGWTQEALIKDVSDRCTGYEDNSDRDNIYPLVSEDGKLVLSSKSRTSEKKHCPYFR